eukprot:scaffold19617_cov127-Isochrysis_galbana.AAC.1
MKTSPEPTRKRIERRNKLGRRLSLRTTSAGRGAAPELALHQVVVHPLPLHPPDTAAVKRHKRQSVLTPKASRRRHGAVACATRVCLPTCDTHRLLAAPSSPNTPSPCTPLSGLDRRNTRHLRPHQRPDSSSGRHLKPTVSSPRPARSGVVWLIVDPQ